jgi:hypothetical protein
VEVLHRRLDVRVAHPFLDTADVRDADDSRAEGVAQVVEAERAEGGSLEGSSVALGEGGAVEVAAGDAGEDDIVIVDEALALAEAGEGFRDLRCHRDGADSAGLR